MIEQLGVRALQGSSTVLTFLRESNELEKVNFYLEGRERDESGKGNGCGG